MKELISLNEKAKRKALNFMNNGELNAYFDALIEMNYYKNLMVAVQSN